MKIIYKIILFLLLINIFIPLVKSLNIFPNEGEGDSQYYQLDNPENAGDESEVFERTSGYEVESLFSASSMSDLSVLFGALFLGGIVALITHSIAPIAISLFLGTFINLYRNSLNIVGQLNINPYVVLAVTMTILVIIVITIIEYMTHGDVSDS